MSDSSLNPKKFHLCEGGALGFSDAVERVAVAWPPSDEPDAVELSTADVARVRRETIVRVLDWLTSGQKTAETVGRRCVLLAFLLRLPSAPSTLAELGARLGVSKTRAHQIISELKLNAENTDFTGEFAENDQPD